MPSTTHTTRRLLACLEAHGFDEEGLIGREDWPALSALFDRELALLNRLALERASAPRATASTAAATETETDAEVMARAEALRLRFSRIQDVLLAARDRADSELRQLQQAGQRVRAVHTAYRHSG